MYTFESRIRYSECDADGLLSITGLLNYFQDCSTLQSEDLGVGVEALHKRGTMWVVNSWQIDILRLPRLSDRVEIGTMPYDCRGFFGKRNFFMKDYAGAYLAKADSLWTYLSMESASPERIPQDILDAYVIDPRLDMEYVGRKIPVPKTDEGARIEKDILVTEHLLGRKIAFPKNDDETKKADEITVNEHLLDANHHVNNGKYVEVAASYLPEGHKVERLRVEYRKQAFLGEIMRPYIYETGDDVIVKLADTDGNPYTIVSFGEMP